MGDGDDKPDPFAPLLAAFEQGGVTVDGKPVTIETAAMAVRGLFDEIGKAKREIALMGALLKSKL